MALLLGEANAIGSGWSGAAGDSPAKPTCVGTQDTKESGNKANALGHEILLSNGAGDELSQGRKVPVSLDIGAESSGCNKNTFRQVLDHPARSDQSVAPTIDMSTVQKVLVALPSSGAGISGLGPTQLETEVA